MLLLLLLTTPHTRTHTFSTLLCHTSCRDTIGALSLGPDRWYGIGRNDDVDGSGILVW